MGGVFVVGGRDLHYAPLSNVAPLSAPMPKCALQKPLMLYFDLKKIGVATSRAQRPQRFT